MARCSTAPRSVQSTSSRMAWPAWRNKSPTDQITVFHSTPTVYRYFLGALSEPPSVPAGPCALQRCQFPKVRLVVLGGEKVVKSDVELYQQHFSRTTVSSSTVWARLEATVTLQNFIDKQTRLAGDSVPVGLPSGRHGSATAEQGRQAFWKLAAKSRLSLLTWRSATGATLRPLPGHSPRTAAALRCASIALATWAGVYPTAALSSKAEKTFRSRSEVSGSSLARSRRRWASTRWFARASWLRKTMKRETHDWSRNVVPHDNFGPTNLSSPHAGCPLGHPNGAAPSGTPGGDPGQFVVSS